MAGRLISGAIDCVAMALLAAVSAGLTWAMWY